jgi:hypothetical protein
VGVAGGWEVGVPLAGGWEVGVPLAGGCAVAVALAGAVGAVVGVLVGAGDGASFGEVAGRKIRLAGVWAGAEPAESASQATVKAIAPSVERALIKVGPRLLAGIERSVVQAASGRGLNHSGGRKPAKGRPAVAMQRRSEWESSGMTRKALGRVR